MARKLISSGSTFEKEIGYSRAVVVDNWVLVSGTTGFDYSKMTISDDLLEQAEQCFKNIEAALQQAGSSMKDVVRVTYVFPETGDFEKCWPVMRKYLGDVRPSAMMLTAGLSDPRMKIEIQATAYRNTEAE
ncbi:RidA family protein [Nitrosomonas sp.]|uniref:RidA family protein n=1 Tax=Nitrosomonas sp. TaxID=42353 RepID=UPI0025ED8641|nr:RidA family protein [Nitrosomonas sp.]MBV6447620.1 putative aminoacrylate peracid reductase RutC [Nitrosomonas sp.]